VSKVDLRLQCGMPCSKLEVSTAQHGTLSGAGYLHQSHRALGLPEGGAGRNLAASDAPAQTAHACRDRPRQQNGPFNLGHADKGRRLSSSWGCDTLIHDQAERPRERRACEEVEERKGK
jgi:hypothetical protein